MIVEIVPARRKGVTGYVSVGRGSRWGNPYIVGVHGDAGECVEQFRQWLASIHSVDGHPASVPLIGRSVSRLAWGQTQSDGHLRIACPCNGLFADPPAPCHASVLAEALVAAYGGEVRVWKPEEVAL